MAVTAVTVTGTYKKPDNTAASGFVRFQLLDPLQSTDDDTIVATARTEVALDVNGAFSTTLLATDSPSSNPAGLTYRVTEVLDDEADHRVYEIVVPFTEATIDLADKVPVAGAAEFGFSDYQIVTSSTRPASPPEGTMIYETDTDKVLVWNGSSWVPPVAGLGQIGYAEVTANQGSIVGTEVDLTGLTTAVTVGASSRIRVSFKVELSATVATTAARVRIKEDGVEIGSATSTITATSWGFTLDASSPVREPSTGPHTYKLTVQRISGTGTITNNASSLIPSFILVEDLGPGA